MPELLEKPSADTSYGRLGQQIYDEQIRPLVEADHFGEFLVVDVDTGRYLIDPDPNQASFRAADAFPGARRYRVRIGYPAALMYRGLDWPLTSSR